MPELETSAAYDAHSAVAVELQSAAVAHAIVMLQQCCEVAADCRKLLKLTQRIRC
jgi:hypothetical protein